MAQLVVWGEECQSQYRFKKEVPSFELSPYRTQGENPRAAVATERQCGSRVVPRGRVPAPFPCAQWAWPVPGAFPVSFPLLWLKERVWRSAPGCVTLPIETGLEDTGILAQVLAPEPWRTYFPFGASVSLCVK